MWEIVSYFQNLVTAALLQYTMLYSLNCFQLSCLRVSSEDVLLLCFMSMSIISHHRCTKQYHHHPPFPKQYHLEETVTYHITTSLQNIL